nr:zinc finger, CCHC-type [Tanacetum cinerariifolium]
SSSGLSPLRVVLIIATYVASLYLGRQFSGRLSRHISSPRKEHWNAINQVFKYLKQTMDYGLEYNGDPSVLEGYTDVSWITDQEDYASTSEWIFTLGGGAMPWGSKKQSCLKDSVIAVEFMALASCYKEA